MDAGTELHSVQAISSYFHGFDHHEVQRLAGAMTMAEFREDEKIMEKGEQASWFGLVLRGTVRAVITADISFNIHRGEFLGEQSIFEGPTAPAPVRSASVVGANDGLLGLITFDELQTFIRDEPALGLKLVTVLSKSSVAKLDAEKARAIQESRPPRGQADQQRDEDVEPLSVLLKQFKVVAAASPALGALSDTELDTLFTFAKVWV